MDNKEYSLEKGWMGVVYCLCVDMIQSTEYALKRTTQDQNRFNNYLVKQINPHIRNLALEDSNIQFTGDGWLVMTEKEYKVPALCCFAMILSKRFQDEMAFYTGLEKGSISALRLAIGSGVDMSVVLPDGSRHWVGDSARRSVRAASVCHENEVLVDYSVLRNVLDDFDIQPINMDERKAEGLGLKMEEALHLHTLKSLTPKITEDSEHPEWFTYTMGTIGQLHKSSDLAQESAQILIKKMKSGNYSYNEALDRRNRLIDSLVDFHTSYKLMDQFELADIPPNTETYHTLIHKADDYITAIQLMAEAKHKGIEPDLEMYTKIIKKAPSLEEGEKVLSAMRGSKIDPNQAVYHLLINKCEDFNRAKSYLAQMLDAGIEPNFNIYIQLVSLAEDYHTAKEVVSEMEEKGIPPNVVTYGLLRKKIHDYEEVTVFMDEIEAKGIPSDFVF